MVAGRGIVRNYGRNNNSPATGNSRSAITARSRMPSFALGRETKLQVDVAGLDLTSLIDTRQVVG